MHPPGAEVNDGVYWSGHVGLVRGVWRLARATGAAGNGPLRQEWKGFVRARTENYLAMWTVVTFQAWRDRWGV